MKTIVLGILALNLLCTVSIQSLQSEKQTDEVDASSLPSNEEIDDLLSKASEYVATYQTTFQNAKSTLRRRSDPGLHRKIKRAMCASKPDNFCDQEKWNVCLRARCAHRRS